MIETSSLFDANREQPFVARSKGIKPDRLTAKGFGETEPKTVNAQMAKQYTFLKVGDVLNEEYINKITDFGKKEICHQLNRRVHE